MTYKKHLTNFTVEELKRIGFMEIPIGETILTLLEQSVDISNDNPEVIKQIFSMLSKLVDNEVLSPITESDFEDEGNGIKRCTRYPYLYKQDGRYWDDRAVAFRRADSAETDRMYIYQTGNNSKQEVELPYFPREEVRTLD